MSLSTRLAAKFIKDSDNLSSPAVRTAYGSFSSIVGILCNLLLFAGKITAGIISGSISITADAMNNLSDASSNIISFFGFRLASRPADKEHPYGHGRYEYLSALMVAVLILVIGVELLKSSIEKIINPSPVAFSPVLLVILAVSVAVKLWMTLFNRKIGKLINSKTLLATAADSRNDAVATIAVLAGALVSHFLKIDLDGYMGLLVAAFILFSGFNMVRDTLNPLLGTAPNPELVEKIRNKILSYDGVLGTHDLIVHDYGPGRQFASVHVEMAAEADVLVSHDILDNIEQDFMREDGLHMIAHLDPISTSSSLVNDLRVLISGIVRDIDERLSIHDLRIVQGATHINVIFDCVVPFDVTLREKEIKSRIQDMVKAANPMCNCVITVDRDYAALPH